MHHTMMAMAAASFMGCSVIGCPFTTERVLRLKGYVKCKTPSFPAVARLDGLKS